MTHGLSDPNIAPLPFLVLKEAGLMPYLWRLIP